MRISDWSSDVALPICRQSDQGEPGEQALDSDRQETRDPARTRASTRTMQNDREYPRRPQILKLSPQPHSPRTFGLLNLKPSLSPSRTKSSSVPSRYTKLLGRSEEHTSELQSLMRISYAVFCLK